MNNLYDATIPAFVRGLRNLRSWLKKSETHAGEAGTPMSEFLEARLAPDMHNLIQQVGYAYFTALEAAQNLSGKASPEMGYDETTAGELSDSIDRVVAHLESIRPEDVEKTAPKEVETFLVPDKKVRVDKYVQRLAVPNFYFHVVTAYDVLRHKGVPLGKADYLAGASRA